MHQRNICNILKKILNNLNFIKQIDKIQYVLMYVSIIKYKMYM